MHFFSCARRLRKLTAANFFFASALQAAALEALTVFFFFELAASAGIVKEAARKAAAMVVMNVFMERLLSSHAQFNSPSGSSVPNHPTDQSFRMARKRG